MIPDSFDEITPAWLTDVLADTLGGARVLSIRQTAAAGGLGVTGLVCRLELTLDRPGGPAAVIAKVRNPEFSGGPGGYAREVRFYTELAAGFDLPVPRCFHAAIDGGRFVLILEDLTHLRPGHVLGGYDSAQARDVLDAVATLHGRWWESAHLRARSWPTFDYPPARAEKLVERYRGVWPRYHGQTEWPVTDALLAAGDAVTERLPEDLARLTGGPRTLIHIDPHVENILLQRRELHRRGARHDVYILDWQEAALGHCGFDLATLIAGNVQAGVQASELGALLARYHARLDAPDYPLSALTEDYAAAVRWMFVIAAIWLVDYKPPTPHDRRTLEKEWGRTSAALLLNG